MNYVSTIERMVYSAVEQHPELFNWMSENTGWLYEAIMWWYPVL